MAQFEIHEEEGMRYVRVLLSDETVRAEAGALAYMRGSLTMTAKIPSVFDIIRSGLSEQEAVRPSYTGSGELFLESSLGGYYVFEPKDQAWIIEAGAYWASEGSVELGVHRERVWVSLWTGEGFIDFQTHVRGSGKVVLNATGPVQEVDIAEGEEIAVEGKLVIGRTAGVHYFLRRSTRSILGSYLSGEKPLRVFRGPGKVLMSATPYWNSFILSRLSR
jgi:uncharacterized protein (AIM24 family)